MTETRRETEDKWARPSYERDPKRLEARIAILESVPRSQERDTLIAYYRRCLAAVQP